MKKVLYILLIFIVTLSLSNKVYAESCDREDINRLKEIAKNVEIKYEWAGRIETDVTSSNAYYNITISGITDELQLFEEKDYQNYFYNDSKNGVINDIVTYGKKKYIIYSSNCRRELLSKKITLPEYNEFSDTEECTNAKEKLYVCEKWVDEEISQDEFDKVISNYNVSQQLPNKIVNNIKKYNSLIIACSLLIIIIFIYFFIRNKKRGKIK